MYKEKSRWFALLAASALLIGAANAWGFSLPAAPGKWGDDSGEQHADEASGHGWSGSFAAGHSGHFGAQWSDDDSDSAGGPGFGPGHDWRPGSGGGNNSDHAWWGEFLLGNGMTGSGLEEWLAHREQIRVFKKQLWMRLFEHWREEHYHDIAPVPLPVPLLLFGSALAGLAGFVRRSRAVMKRP